MSLFNRILNQVFDFLFEGLDLYSKIFFELARMLGLPATRLPQKEPIDDRLKRLDDARAALSETLSAIKELSEEIERSKKEHQTMLDELNLTLSSKKSADAKLENLRKLLEVDENTLREVTAPRTGIRQHTIGFILGVLASLVAAALIFLAPLALEAFNTWSSN